jgi:phosphonatase-like hydrolase
LSLSRRESLKRLASAAALPSAASASRGARVPAIRLVVLDVGGTIIEDRGDIPELMRAALSHHGVASTPAEIARQRGASKREVVRYFVDRHPLSAGESRDTLVSAIYEEFAASVIAVYRNVPPISGAEEAIRKLRERGLLVATTTGFDRAITSSIFQRLGWERYFVASICSDDVAQGRPAPFMLFHAMEAARVDSVAEVMAVGDTPLDLQAGSNAGLGAVVGVLTGAGNSETLRREPHTHILPSVAGVPGLLGGRA